MLRVLITCLFLILTFGLFAQNTPSVERVKFKKRVYLKVDYNDKINQPIGLLLSQVYETGKFGEKLGVTTALLNAYQEKKIKAYYWDTLYKELPFDTFFVMANHYSNMKDSVEKVKDIDDMAEDSHEEEIETEKEWMESEDTTVKDTVIPPDFARNLEDVFGIIEDRIMDNGEGKMIYDIQYLLLFNSDRTATLAEEPILAFKYQDIRKLIHLMQPKKKFNEIYYKSFAE